MARQNSGLVDDIRCCFGLQQEGCELLADPSESGGRWRGMHQVAMCVRIHTSPVVRAAPTQLLEDVLTLMVLVWVCCDSYSTAADPKPVCS